MVASRDLIILRRSFEVVPFKSIDPVVVNKGRLFRSLTLSGDKFRAEESQSGLALSLSFVFFPLQVASSHYILKSCATDRFTCVSICRARSSTRHDPLQPVTLRFEFVDLALEPIVFDIELPLSKIDPSPRPPTSPLLTHALDPTVRARYENQWCTPRHVPL
jgi:hypothetical protein